MTAQRIYFMIPLHQHWTLLTVVGHALGYLMVPLQAVSWQRILDQDALRSLPGHWPGADAAEGHGSCPGGHRGRTDGAHARRQKGGECHLQAAMFLTLTNDYYFLYLCFRFSSPSGSPSLSTFGGRAATCTRTQEYLWRRRCSAVSSGCRAFEKTSTFRCRRAPGRIRGIES